MQTPKNLLITVLSLIFLRCSPAQAQTSDHQVYLPLVAVVEPPPETVRAIPIPENRPSLISCRMTRNNNALFCAVIPFWHKLCVCERALDMGTRRYFSHVNPDGYGPNYLVQQAGYALPSFYGQEPDANNIEFDRGWLFNSQRSLEWLDGF